jgi:carbamoyltransferase
MQSPFESAICLTADGSGDQHTTVVWEKRGERLRCLREIRIPHSLGWVYAAFTEFLGFDAYDGEYKVMGLAAFGSPRPDLQAKLRRVVTVAEDGVEFRVDPRFIHYGNHRFSGRFTDELLCLLGRPPRRPDEEITEWHMDLAHAVQDALEVAVERLVVWAVRATGLTRICVGGGVGLNVKLNSRLFEHPEIEDVFVQPLCSDGGAAVGAALVACHQAEGALPRPLETLALGNEESDSTIVRALNRANLAYERPSDICDATAAELAAGRIVGWIQGRMEAGPRALGQRSILADPRQVQNRDRVNAAVKYRELWRPFCPSLPAELAGDYFDHHTAAPFMTIAFRANERLVAEAPAVVHVDGTVRAQLVSRPHHDRFHRLLRKFGDRTGVPILLNTSFNVKGEPIVATTEHALRTFWSTGLEVLVLGNLMIRKPLPLPAQ